MIKASYKVDYLLKKIWFYVLQDAATVFAQFGMAEFPYFFKLFSRSVWFRDVLHLGLLYFAQRQIFWWKHAMHNQTVYTLHVVCNLKKNFFWILMENVK